MYQSITQVNIIQVRIHGLAKWLSVRWQFYRYF